MSEIEIVLCIKRGEKNVSNLQHVRHRDGVMC